MHYAVDMLVVHLKHYLHIRLELVGVLAWKPVYSQKPSGPAAFSANLPINFVHFCNELRVEDGEKDERITQSVHHPFENVSYIPSHLSVLVSEELLEIPIWILEG